MICKIGQLFSEFINRQAFLEGKDIYCASASQMFHVPVVKHGINGELRQKGKVAELACGYGGSSGALISMGALQMGLKEEELPEIIDLFLNAEDRCPAEESDYRYKKSKPVTAMKAKRDEEGFFIPWNNTHPKPENWRTVRSKICPVCGREFSYRHQYGLERKYCSRGCANRGRKKEANRSE